MIEKVNKPVLFFRKNALKIILGHILLIHILYIITYNLVVFNYFSSLDWGITYFYPFIRSYVFYYLGFITPALLIFFNKDLKITKWGIVGLVLFTNYYLILLIAGQTLFWLYFTFLY